MQNNVLLLSVLFYLQTVQALNICYRDPKLKYRHKPLIHALLGMYAMSMNITDSAENQLTMSLNVSSFLYLVWFCLIILFLATWWL